MVGVSAVLAQRLSRLVIDVDKDWAGRRILNLTGITSPGDLVIFPRIGYSVFIGNNDGLRGFWITAEGEADSTNQIRNSGLLSIMGRYWAGTAPHYFGFILQTILESAAPYGRLSVSTPTGEVVRIYPDKIDMLNKPIKNLANPTDPQDAVTKSYVDPVINWVNNFKARLRTSSASTTADSNITVGAFVSPLSLSISANHNAIVLLNATGQITYGVNDIIDVRIARGANDICYGQALNTAGGARTFGFDITCIDSIAAGSYTYALRLMAVSNVQTLRAGARFTALIIETPP